jgi:poly(3-hydroxyalkanoate) synthetase
MAMRVRAVMDCDARTELGQVQVPILYLQAKHDRLVKKNSFKQIQQVKPDVTLALISAPHLVLQREPHKAAGLIAKFVQGLS